MNDLFEQELDSLQRKTAALTLRAATARDAAAVAALGGALSEVEAGLESLRLQHSELVRRYSTPSEGAQRRLRRREDEEYQGLLDALPSPAWKTDARGGVLYINRAWCEYTGFNVRETLDGRWAEAMDPEDRTSVTERWLQAHETGAPVQHEYRLRRYDGAHRWHHVHVRPIKDPAGVIAAWIAIASDIHELKEAEAKIQRLYDETRMTADRLKTAVEAKDEFLGLMSHELKTPITMILGNAEVLLKRQDQIDRAAKMAALSDIHEEGSRLHRIVEDLLSLARIERGQHVDVEPLLLGHVVARMLAEHSARYPRRQFETRIGKGQQPALGDCGYVEQILRNLLSNAEKYSPHDRPIRVAVHALKGEVEVVIGDQGSGLREDEAERIFLPFVRLQRTASQASGSGIGLAVCKRLVEAQSGRISARPRAGGGSEFCFALPAADAPEGDDV